MIELYEDRIIRDIIDNMKVSSIDADDLEQEIYMILLEYDNDKIIEMYKNEQLRYFIVGVLQRQYFSNTSPFYKKYKKYYSFIDGNNNNNNDDMIEYD